MSDEARQQRLDRARFAIWVELLTGLVVAILTGFVSISRLSELPDAAPVTRWVLLAVPVAALLAWVWMARLSRPQPEAGDRTWRYRERAA